MSSPMQRTKLDAHADPFSTMGRYARMQHADSSLSWTESSRCAVYSESSMTPAAAAAEFHAPSKEERAAGRALCPELRSSTGGMGG